MRFLPLFLLLLVVICELVEARFDRTRFRNLGGDKGRRIRGKGNRGGKKWRIENDFQGQPSQRRQEFQKVRSLMRDFFKRAAERDGKRADFNVETLSDQLPERQDDGTEVFNNYGTEGDLFESDIVLTLPQMQDIVRAFDQGGRKKRKVINGNQYRWKSRSISYSIAASDSKTINAVRAGLRHWEQHTCLRFREGGGGSDQLRFIKGQGCYSNIGRIGGVQDVSIGDRCEILGIVAHEVGHAMGFWHEQSRPDRAGYITVNTGNILNGFQGNFQKRSSSHIANVGGTYDLGSVMHYGPKGFTVRQDLNTIDTRDPNYRNTIGQRERLSFMDIKQINNVYCSNSCSRSLSCRHGGYADPNSCQQCKCPEGLAGNCDRVQSSKSRCGGELSASTQWQSVSSPSVSANQECYWRISNPQGRKVVVEVSSINFACQDTCGSYLEVKYANLQQTGPRFCCTRPSTSFKSSSTDIVLIQRTDSYGSNGYTGFKARYRAEGSSPGPSPRPPTQRPRTQRPRTQRPRTSRPRTPRPVTRRPPTLGRTGQWSAWSQCSVTCGGCGKQKRTKPHLGHLDVQRKSCGSRVCRSTTTGGGGICQGRVTVPCSMLRYLNQMMDAKNGHTFTMGDLPRRASVDLGRGSSHDSDERHQRQQWGRRPPRGGSRRGGRPTTGGGGNGSGLCTKTFKYQCNSRGSGGSIRIVTVGGRTTSSTGSACCPGYQASGSVCLRSRTTSFEDRLKSLLRRDGK